MGLVEGRGGEERGVMKGSCELMGHKMYSMSPASALSVTMSFQTRRQRQREYAAKIKVTGKETGCAKIISEKIGCKTPLKAYDPDMRRKNRQTE